MPTAEDESRFRLAVEDMAVVETEDRSRAAVALCVDLSFSMVSEGRWAPMKRTALALQHLVSTRYAHDSLQVVGFDCTVNTLDESSDFSRVVLVDDRDER